MVPKKLIVAVEGTAAIGAFWQTIFSDYLDKIIRCFCGNEATGQKPSTTHVELSVVMFSTHGSYSSCLVQRSGWTRDMDTFFQWLSAIPFAGGGFNDAAIAEGLAEALMMFSSPSGNQNQNVEGERHCILVAASNPYPLPTPVYRPKFQNPEKTDRIETQPDNCLSDAETLAKSFAQCAISLSIICPKQLPKLRGIYNAGKRDPRAGDPPVVNVKNPHFLVLISENFMEARSSLCGPGLTSLPSNQNPVKMDVTPVAPVSGPPPASAPSANGSVLVRPPISVGNILPATVKLEPPTLPSVTGPAFPNISSVPRPVSQAVPSFQTSSPMSTSQDTIPNNENAPDTKPSATYLTPSMRPAGMAAANVRILNDVAQARQALAGGTSIGLPSKTPVLSYMISSGMTTPSISTAQTVASVTGQNAQSPTSLAMSQPVSNNQGSVELGQSQTHPGMSQGNFSAARMVQTGMSVNQSMMSMSQQGQPGMVPAGVNSNNSVSNMTLNQHTSSTVQSAQSKYVRVWEGNLSGQRQGQPVFIARLEGYRNASASETLAARWPPTMQIVRLISQDHMNNRHYAGKADFLVFRALNQHGFLGQLQEKKLCAVIQLPSQTLMLSVSDKAHRLIGMLFPGDMVVFKPQIPNQQLQLQQQNLQQQQQQQQPMQMQHIVGMNQQEAAAAYIQGGGPGPGRSQIGQVSSQGPTTTMSGGGSFMS